MSQYWNYPKLKRGIDLQLQTAYNGGDWQRASRLSAKKAMVPGPDQQYYEIVKTYAESQFDQPAARYSAVMLCYRYLQNQTVIQDVESFLLLTEATNYVTDISFRREVIGPLRLRAVKSGKLNRAAMIACLHDCLQDWDLENAQQIAAFMNRSFKQERSYLFWNIAITFLLSTSEQCPKEKRFLYSTLATRMASKVLQNAPNIPTKSAIQEEEVLFYYGIVSSRGSFEDWQGLIDDKNIGPLAQCHLGRKNPFLIALKSLEKLEAWDTIYSLTKAGMSAADSSSENFKPSVLASDWVLWQYYLHAAGKLVSTNTDILETTDLLLDTVFPPDVVGIHRRTLNLAKITACFELPTADSGSKAIKLMTDMILNMTSLARFEDFRPLVERLTKEDQYALLAAISVPKNDSKVLDVVMRRALSSKLRFFVASCHAASAEEFENIVLAASADLQSLVHPNWQEPGGDISTLLMNLDMSDSAAIKAEILPEFSILIATALVQLSGITSGKTHESKYNYLLQAVAILENQLHITPKDHTVLILLVRLHIILGSAWRAKEVWDVLEVKRTIVDSLAPLFLDRLSTVSPSLVSGDKIIKTVTSYYDLLFRKEMPKSLIQAITANSYASVIQIPKYIDSLRGSSTRAMGFLEKQRSTRAFSGIGGEWTMSESSVYGETINYGPFPNLESSSTVPIYNTLSIGPGPSNCRTQLLTATEKFFHLLYTHPPNLYKPSPAALVTDETCVAEELTRLSNTFSQILHGDVKSKLTSSEYIHYQIVALLSLFILSSCSPVVDTTYTTKSSVDSIVESLPYLVMSFEARLSNTSDSTQKALRFFSSLHDLWYIRDTAVAIRVSLDYITAFNSRQKPAKPPNKDFSANLKALARASAEAVSKGKGWIAATKKTVTEPGLERKVITIAFDRSEISETVKQASGVEGASSANWARKIVDSWKINIKGWENVKWD